MALSNYLNESTISLNLEAETSTEVIQHLGKKLMDAGLVKDSFIEAAITRESTLPTGLPLDGDIHVAIPHTDIIHVIQSGVAMATLTKPVTFQNMVMPSEDVNVSIVFMLAIDQPHAQIEMLQEIAELLQDPVTLQRLKDAKEAQDVINAFAEISK
ncbi:MAG: PTS sugar transporter subunit IIA [Anaerolineaceae bacterium]